MLEIFGVRMLCAKITGLQLSNNRFVGDGFRAYFGHPPLSKICVLDSSVERAVLAGRPPLSYVLIPFSCPVSIIVFVFFLCCTLCHAVMLGK